MRKILTLLILLVVVVGGLYSVVRWYPYIFAKSIDGVILKVERVSQPEAVIATGGQIPRDQLFSFAVAIRDAGGEIHTASSEDRQWAVAEPGKCVVARFLKYPPWYLDKGGTYYAARLERLYDCPPGANAHAATSSNAVTTPPAGASVAAPAAAPAPAPAPAASVEPASPAAH